MSDGHKHAGKDTLDAMHENDAHTTGSNDAVPGGGGHTHSPAAHENGPKAHTKPVGDQRALADKEESIRDTSATKNHRGN